MWPPTLLLRLTALGSCVLAAGFSAFELLANHAVGRTSGCLVEELLRRAGMPDVFIAVSEVALVVLFGGFFWRSTQETPAGGSNWKPVAPLWIQTVIGVGVGAELLGLVSFAAPLALERRRAQWFLGVVVSAQIAGFLLLTRLTGSHPLEKLVASGVESRGWEMLFMVAMASTWHGLTFSLGLFGAVERQRAMELARANALLAATRMLDAETARVAVRLGISRDLHDASGHHLAALNVNLRLMRRMEGSEPLRQKIDECLFVVGQLLGDVREVVKDLRGLQKLDLREILGRMAQGFEGMVIHLEIDEELTQAEPYFAHTLFRCAQEIITNAARHGEARNLWLALRRTSAGYTIEARDDGKGVSEFSFGNGLTGMRERVVEIGGNFEASSRVGEGFRVELQIPVRSFAA